MKIITVCGMGVGTSLMLKMAVESALSNLNLMASVEHWDMGTVKGIERDFIVTSEEFRENFKDDPNIVFITNIMNVAEVQEKISKFLSKKGE